jgi:hypothetical protein
MMDPIMTKKKDRTRKRNENTLWKWGYKKLYRLTKHRNKGSWDGQREESNAHMKNCKEAAGLISVLFKDANLVCGIGRRAQRGGARRPKGTSFKVWNRSEWRSAA